jgi:hypothetical protein
MTFSVVKPNVTQKPFLLSVIVLNVVMLNIVAFYKICLPFQWDSVTNENSQKELFHFIFSWV